MGTQISKDLMLVLRNFFTRAGMLPELLFYDLALGSDAYRKYFQKHTGSPRSLNTYINHSLVILT